MESRGRDALNSLGLLILRLGIGGFMLTHGWGKLQLLMEGNFNFVGDPIGIGEKLSAVGVVAAEFGCAILIMAGLLTRVGAVGIVFAMAVAAFAEHGNDPWTMTEGFQRFMEQQDKMPPPRSKEPALLFLIPGLALIFTGAGKVSLDYLIWKRCCSRRGAEPGQR